MKKLILIITLLICSTQSVFAYDFAVIRNSTNAPTEVRNIYVMFDALKNFISYKNLTPSQVSDSSLSDVNGIISFVDNSETPTSTAITAVKNFAKNHVVISNGYDFAKYYYSSLSSYYSVSSKQYYSVNYSIDWGEYIRKYDRVEMQRSDQKSLGVFLTSQLTNNFGRNFTQIAKYNDTYTAFFRVNYTTNPNYGFYVMDLKATANESGFHGIWHIFQPIKLVKNFPTGNYTRWMGIGRVWPDLQWINNLMNEIASENSDIVETWKIGTSLEGRDINATVIGKGNKYVIVDGLMHGEKSGTFSALRVAELLVDYYRSDPSWQTKLNQYKVILIPVLNPDAFVRWRRFNSRSILDPTHYNLTITTTNVINGTWINHGLPTTSGIETSKCTITGTPPNIKGGTSKKDNYKFQVKLINTSDNNNYVTKPISITWNCWVECCNINRQFPPNAVTTEPEAWALRNLIDTYKPSIYINYHEGGCDYPLNILYGIYLYDNYGNFTRYALNQASNSFASLKHWGVRLCKTNTINIGKVWSIGRAGQAGMAVGYVSKYYNISSEILETFSGVATKFWGLDYYPTITINHIKHFDEIKDNFLFTSDAFITYTEKTGDLLKIKLDSKELTSTSTIFINDIKNKGKPKEILIDGNKKGENNGWYYDSNNRNITVKGAKKSIWINWGPQILVAHWKFDDNALDSSGNGNSGTVSGATYTTGKSGSALKFSGTNIYVSILDSPSLDVTKLTIEAWINASSWSSSTYPRIVSKEATTSAAPYALELNSSGKSVDLCLDTGSGEKCVDSGANSISLNQWYYVVGTWNGTHSQIYVNGDLKKTLAQSGSMTATSNNVTIGNNYPSKNRQYNGIIDEVKIYNYSLSAEDILSNYKALT